ncbi:DUF4238 domain-containing protein [Vibrio fluvialis]|nr:DUF4238 domain-containing protein [Vibrio fluvialis]
MANKNDKKKNHHYVYGNYLKPWMNEKNEVFYLSKKKNISSDSVKSILKEDYFYKIKGFSELELEIILLTIKKAHPRIAKKHIEFLVKIIQVLVKEHNQKVNVVSDPVAERELDIEKSNTVENMHCEHENKSLPILNLLRNGNVDCLNNDNYAYDFYLYIGQQIARTKNFRELSKIFSELNTDASLDDTIEAVQNCWWFLCYILGTNLGLSLYESRSKMTKTLLINKTSLPFITSDQPVVSLIENTNPDVSFSANSFDLYYPLSPSHAIVISEKKYFKSGVVKITKSKVDELNRNIAMQSRNTIITNNPDLVLEYKRLLGTRLKGFMDYAKNNSVK